jgi:hypothetical protein
MADGTREDLAEIAESMAALWEQVGWLLICLARRDIIDDEDVTDFCKMADEQKRKMAALTQRAQEQAGEGSQPLAPSNHTGANRHGQT